MITNHSHVYYVVTGTLDFEDGKPQEEFMTIVPLPRVKHNDHHSQLHEERMARIKDILEQFYLVECKVPGFKIDTVKGAGIVFPK